MELPSFRVFWQTGNAAIQMHPGESNPLTILMEGFREDPEANRLKTPTGEIQILSFAQILAVL
ncbi:MAG: hypothetical protein ACI8PT_004095 [Gammaproteobacteria bacterium]